MTSDKLKLRFEYDEITGALFHKRRADRSPQWNGRYAGKETGYVANNGYRMIEIEGAMHLSHRVIWMMANGAANAELDHINGNRLDNRLCNLRLATREQNARNQKRHADGSAPYKGVSLFRRTNKWTAQIRLDGKKKHLGYFANPVDAANAYDEAARKNYGAFALTNF